MVKSSNFKLRTTKYKIYNKIYIMYIYIVVYFIYKIYNKIHIFYVYIYILCCIFYILLYII